MMVVTDRLSKDVVLAGLLDLKATTVVKALITFVVAVTVNRQKLPERDGITQNLIEPYGI